MLMTCHQKYKPMATDSIFNSEIELIDGFLADQNISKASKKTYNSVLIRFFRWARNTGRNFQNLRYADFRKYLETFNDCSDLTKYNHLNVLKLHFNWQEANSLHKNYIKGNLAKHPRRYRVFRKRPLNLEQAKQLMEKPNQETIKGARDYALLMLLLFNGLRIIEVQRANLGDITDKGETLYIQRKGANEKSERIRLPEATQEALNGYLIKRKNLNDSSPLIAAHSINNPGGRINTESASRIVKSYLVAIGLNSKWYTAHSLRHSAASLLLELGATPNDLQGFLGHRSFSTSQLYTQYAEENRIYNSNFGQKLVNAVLTS